MNRPDSRSLHGRALLDFFAGDTAATIVIHSSLGEHEEIPVSVFFRDPGSFFPFEQVALELCRGRVLEVGAGTGSDALRLQDLGFEVCAIDILPEAVEIMRRRGVSDARVADVTTFVVEPFEAEPFDTVLMMMNGIGILGTLDGLDRFLLDVPKLLRPGGQVLLDSGPGRVVGESGEPAVQVPVDTEESYCGETWIELEYRGERGLPFRELYADSETLTRHAEAAAWNPEVVFRDELGGYVARLTRV